MGLAAVTKWRNRAIVCLAGLITLIGFLIKSLTSETDSQIISWCLVCAIIWTSIIATVCWDISSLEPSDSHTFISLMLQYLLTRIVYQLGKYAAYKYTKGTKSMISQQEKFLLKLLSLNSKTEYGKDHNFEMIKSVEDFRKQHPVTSYDHYDSYIKRIYEGHNNVLTKSDTLYFCSTSGTTGNSKMFPTCKLSICHTAIATLAQYIAYHKGAKVNLQRQFWLYVKSNLKESKSGLKIGPASSFIFQHIPTLVSPKETSEISNELAAMYVHGLFVLSEPEMGILLFFYALQAYNFFKYLEKNWDDLCNDIENGTVSVKHPVDKDILRVVKLHFQPNKTRADQLRHAMNEYGITGLAKRIWPGISHCKVTCTGAMAVYAKHLRQTYLKDIPLISFFYGATEGYYGVSLTPDLYDTTYTLGYRFGFLEFLPMESMDEEHVDDDVVLPQEVKIGSYYEIITTNHSGLCRYRSGDIVKITDFINQCPIIEYTDRKGQILNVAGERTPESVLYRAIIGIMCRLDVTLIDYTTCEDIYLKDIEGIEHTETGEERRYYVLFLELDRKLTSTEEQMFDEALCEESSSYKWVRTFKQTVTPIKIVQLKPGTLADLKQEMITESTNYQQYKLPRVLRKQRHLEYLVKNAYII